MKGSKNTLHGADLIVTRQIDIAGFAMQLLVEESLMPGNSTSYLARYQRAAIAGLLDEMADQRRLVATGVLRAGCERPSRTANWSDAWQPPGLHQAGCLPVVVQRSQFN